MAKAGGVADICQHDREELRLIVAQQDAAVEAVAKINSDDIKGRLRTNTEELVARGGFGSPSMFINGSDMYFGNDRLPLVEAALTRAVQAES